MPETIMHCFDPEQAEAEGKIIGSLLAGYGELELEMANCLIAASGKHDNSIKTIYRVWSAEKRIETAKAAMRCVYISAGLQIPYKETMANMDWCRRIRNQYAHCQWIYIENDSFYFIDLEELAKQSGEIGTLTDHKIKDDLIILQQQMSFFVHVRRYFWFLAEQCQRYMILKRKPEAVLSSPVHAMPPAMDRPPMHI